MTGTDLPTVVRRSNPRSKSRPLRSKPAQTAGSLRPETHLRTHLHRNRPGTFWHVPKYMREADILTDPARSRYDGSMVELVELGGTEYEATPCASCKTTGQRYDPTLADNIHTRGSGMIRCPHCDGAGTVYRITSRGIDQERQRWEARQARA